MERRSDFQGPPSGSVGQQLAKEATSFSEFGANGTRVALVPYTSAVSKRKTALEFLSD